MEGKPSISEMATETDSDVTKLKGTKILVHVEDALFDVLIVSFSIGNKIFQGALLDVTKKNAPYGITPPDPPKPKEGETSSGATEGTTEEKTDKLYALKQRHTYYQVPPGSHPFIFGPYRPFGRSAKDKSVRMRRLRPRKVLCSHCQVVVNDNDPNQKRVEGVVTRNNASNKNSQCASADNENGANTGSATNANQRIITRSTKTELSDKNDSASSNAASSADSKSDGERVDTKSGEFILRSNLRTEKMVLRKRKSTDLEMDPSTPEKLKRVDALKVEEADSTATVVSGTPCSKPGLAKTSPVIKISFANPQGKDTVLKIPARIQNASDTEEDSNWSLQENSNYSVKNFASAKAAKKALKKAKKEAQKRASANMNSPTTAVLSPSNENGETQTAAEKEKHHHHKHKVKRKRKHKNGDTETEKYDLENTDTRNVFNSNNNDGWCLRTNFPGDINGVPGEINKTSNVFEEVKHKCLQQKLSISLKRLNAKAYTRCSPKYSIEEDSIASDVSTTSNVSMCSGSGSDYSDVPDFPKHSSPLRDMDKVKPLMMRISTHNVKKCVLDIGREMAVGDIVWGKIHGFPWWPGKVLALTVSQRDNGALLNQQAHVSWFGSSTSSYMPCNQLTPFLDEFKIRFNKKKRGPYKEAIKQAMHEAQLPHKDNSEMGLITS